MSTTEQAATQQPVTAASPTPQPAARGRKDTAAAKPAGATAATPPDDTADEQRGYRKTRRGLVVSDRMAKTVVVTVEDRVKHPLYGKVLRRTSRVKAHDEENTSGVGDLVLIMETRPLSASKRWRVVEVLEKAK